MNLTDMITAVRNASGQASTDVIRSAVQLAAEEIWNSVDLPNVLQELRVCTNSERFIALPWQVSKIRKVRTTNGRIDMEINDVTAHYRDQNFYQDDIAVRILRKVPLHTKITNASTVRFKLKKPETFDVSITITGSTDLSGRCIEPVVIQAGSTYQDTVERYINLPDNITKAQTTSADIEILDASGNEIGLFAAHLSECTYYLAQLYDRCVSINSPYLGCFDIIYKPHMPPLRDDNDIFPAPYHQVVIFKALEQIYLKSDETIKVAQAYNAKALSLLQQFSADENTGKTLRPNVKTNAFVTKYAGRL